MAKGIHDLGNGNGWIYIVDPSKTEILRSLVNDEKNARDIRIEGLRAASFALNQEPYATIRVENITGSGSVTGITVNGVNQITGTLAYTGATAVEDLASDIADAINSYDRSADEDYTAVSVGDTVYITGETAIGASHNGLTPVVSNTGNSTYVITDVNGGSDSSEIYNQSYGYTFFLDADYNASGCTGLGNATEDSIANAIEITEHVVPLMMNSAIPVVVTTIADGAISVTRQSAITSINIDTESAAATDDLDTIHTTGFAGGDILIIRGLSSGRVTTIKDSTGNIKLFNSVDFDTDDLSTTLTIQLGGSKWREVSRSRGAALSVSDYRTAGFGFFGVDTFNTAAITGTGTTTFVAGTDSKYQKLTGSVTLSGNTNYSLDATAVNGDSFILEYDASATVGGFTLNIFGIDLTSEQALNGGLIFEAEYKSGAWYSRVYPNLNDGSTYTYQTDTGGLKDGAVTLVKLESDLKKEFFTFPVSWESNEIGTTKNKFPFECTVDEAFISVNTLIEATNDATLNLKNDVGTVMTGGTQTITGGTVVGTNYTLTPTADNTFLAGESMQFETIKTTNGGRAVVTVFYTRT